MRKNLQDCTIAVLATHGVEQAELAQPSAALEQAGARVELVSPEPGDVQAFDCQNKGATFPVSRTVSQANASDYDGLVLPGGVVGSDALRMDAAAVHFVREFFAARKPVGAICHGPWMLVEADAVRHRTVTSWPSLRTDIRNAGGEWVDEPVRVDDRLITSRRADDLPVFCERLIEEVAEHNDPGAPVDIVVSPEDAPLAGHDVAVDVSSADSFPASDAPSSRQIT
jgi:protease I